ncbi:large ribosomal subunit protein mL46-like [Amphiura filiformis]|uniref:large ribosomal subunit protein mL46-like n=1 Tax=Amphiura filiformis TaxID=82378 RepID=UPI003B211697
MAAHMGQFVRKLPNILPLFSRHAVTKVRGPGFCINHQCIKLVHSNPAEAVRQYQLMAAVCLERYPVVSNQLDEVEREYQDLIDQEELEESYLSEHEIKVAHEIDLLERKKKGLMDEEGAEVADMSTLEAEDKAKAELESFEAANTITEADKKNDVRSLDRQLHDRLVLLTKCKLGKDKVWMMPQGNWKEGESLQETAERVLRAHSNSDNLEFKVMNRIPCGFFKYKFPKAVQEESGKVGAKVFFMKARHIEGDFQLNKDMADDYVWVTRNELDKYVVPSYGHEVKKFVANLLIELPIQDIEEELPRDTPSAMGSSN